MFSFPGTNLIKTDRFVCYLFSIDYNQSEFWSPSMCRALSKSNWSKNSLENCNSLDFKGIKYIKILLNVVFSQSIIKVIRREISVCHGTVLLMNTASMIVTIIQL